MNVILYTIGCPQCKVLEAKLDTANIHYTKCDNEEDILKAGISVVPSLEIESIDGGVSIYNFAQAIKWIKEENYKLNGN